MENAYHRRMENFKDRALRIARFAAEAAAETLWPTRCALCDIPGSVLCDRCVGELPPVDWWRACRRCGSPFGYVQCDVCNPVTLSRIGREALPFDACASAVLFGESTGRIVRVYKDQGERRLSVDMALLMARMVPPEWRFDAVTFVPATLSAYRYRGFDHAELIAYEVAQALGAECVGMLSRPNARDQRALKASQRIANLKGGFTALGGLSVRHVLLVDDVYTTGSTLCAATDALKAAGCETVYCLTFARV